MTRDYGIEPPRYRLPESTRVGRVRLQVADLARSLSYYQEVIGLRVLHRQRNGAVLGPHHEHTAIVEIVEHPGSRRVPPHGRYGLYHFAILVPERADLGRFVAHLAARNVRVAAADHLVSEALYLWDPDGLGIEVYADRPRDQWRSKGRQLAMTTEPLDLADVMTAGHGSTWSGMPRGTAIGHMHLHVGDLKRAEAIYHVGLGFDKTVWDFPGALFLSAGGYHHHLGTNTWVEGATTPGDDDARLLEWELRLPARDDVRDAARSLGAATVATRDDGEDCLVTDDWGTTLRLTC